MWPPANLFCLLNSPGKTFCLENTLSHFNLRTINCSTVWLRRNSIQSYIKQICRNSVLLLAVYCVSELCHHIKSCLFFSRCTLALHNKYPFDRCPGNGTLVYSVLWKTEASLKLQHGGGKNKVPGCDCGSVREESSILFMTSQRAMPADRRRH